MGPLRGVEGRVPCPSWDPRAQRTRAGLGVSAGVGSGEQLSWGPLFQGCAGHHGIRHRQVSPPLTWLSPGPRQLRVKEPSGAVLMVMPGRGWEWSWGMGWGGASLGVCSSDSLPGTLPKPSIWADPGPLVAVGNPVTLCCQGSLQAEVYRMYKEGSPQPWVVQAQQDSRHKADFPITMSMSSYHTGQYWCVYWTLLGPSQPSDPLTLVLTGKGVSLPREAPGHRKKPSGVHGAAPPPDMPLPSPAGMFPAPSLSAQPSLMVASGGNVSLSCCSEYDDARTVHLLKEGGAGTLHSLEAWFSHGAGVWQATFLLGPLGSTHAGIYRCYRAHSSQPHVWSLPSEPLELQVTGGPEPSSPSHPQPGYATAPAPEDHTLENLIHMGVAGLVLLGLGLLLAEAWYSHKRIRAACWR
uniref:Immunoglobulin domain-containing protein n=1 Tax=Oryctolagus cuniculus TaxID=9986 RepID=A0A5F9DIA0_RABIT